jgi:hypothetical protein
MRVGLLTPEVAPSYGWARYALDLARGLVDQGITVIALAQPEATAPDFPLAVCPVLPQLVPRPRGFLPRSVLADRKSVV